MREIVINCYKYHGRDDLLPKFSEEEDLKRVQVSTDTDVLNKTLNHDIAGEQLWPHCGSNNLEP